MKRVIVKPYDKYKFEVVEDYSFKSSYNEGIVHKGYTTDGASIPRIFWSIYPPYKSEYFTACVVHDFLCSRALRASSIKEAYLKADKTFKEHLKELGVGRITVFLFFNYVKYFHKIKCFLKGWK